MESAARRLWTSLETVHDVVYFSPLVRAAGLELGLRGFWMTYFAFRAAPFGPVGAPVVTASFAGFHPAMVERALPGAWLLAAPELCLQARSDASVAALQGLGAPGDARVVEMLAPLVTAADPTGRPLFAVNAALPLPTDPLAATWQLATTLREHRGDGHVAALVAAGLSGLQAHHLQVARGRLPAEQLRGVRGWSPDEWSAAETTLQDRGLLQDGHLTPFGQVTLTEIEDQTDDASWAGCLHALGKDGVDEVIALLAPTVAAVRASGVLPVFNPTGLGSR